MDLQSTRSAEESEMREAIACLRWAFVDQPTAIVTVFSIAFLWFDKFLPLLLPFTMTAGQAGSFALLHTIVVGIGLAAGNDVLLAPAARGKLVGQCCAITLMLSLGLGELCFAYKLEPMYSWRNSVVASTNSSIPFTLIGAFALTLWFASAMLLPQLRLGLAARQATKWHAGITAAALAVRTLDFSSSACFLCGGTLAAAAFARSLMPAVVVGANL